MKILTIDQYNKLSYKEAIAYIQSLPIVERAKFQDELYKIVCAKEIADIPKNIKYNCVMCGCHLKPVCKRRSKIDIRYHKRGNFCEECNLNVSKTLKLERGIF